MNIPAKLTVVEVEALVNRLESRGRSILMKDQPEQARDMLLAASLLRELFPLVNAPETAA